MEPEGDPLTEGLAAGRRDAFAALYDRFGAELFRVARAMSGSTQDAEDAVQEVFVSLARARASLGAVKNLRAYLFTALRRSVIRLANRNKMLALTDVEEIAGKDPCLPQAEEAARLEQALTRLPIDQREVVALKVDGGLTFAEIGAILDIPLNTAASRYRYALERLRAALTEDS